MKKNISINISGIIFHVEEDGYEKFKAYLDSINQYFAGYEDSEEIIADIESRIAELFLEKLDDGKQVVTIVDVENLIATMGQIADFEAIEEEEDFTKAEPKAKTQKQRKAKSSSSSSSEGARVLRRDLNKRILGGVASGIGHYFKMDPIWVRVAWLLLFFTGLGILAYIIMWIAVPGSDDLPEDVNVKKLYRDPDDRVLGGVSAGLAKYFNTDAIVFRIIFVILIFGGVGILAYLILWIITPQASSLTEKMQMKGEKVTLSNIDENIKKTKQENLNPKDENSFTKVLLFPFRLIGNIFKGLGKALAPIFQLIVALIRVFIGGIIALVGISSMFSFLVAGGVVLGLYNGDWFYGGDDWAYFTSEVIVNTVPEIGALFLLIALFIPFLFIFIAGITIIAKRRVMSSSTGWSILGIWMIAVVGTFATIPNVIRDFREEASYEVVDPLAIAGDTLIIDVQSVNYFPESRRRYNMMDNEWNESEFSDLDIRVAKDGELKLEKRFYARGRDFEGAQETAKAVEYNYSLDGNKITFDSDITFNRKTKFRMQGVNLNLYIPKNQPFKIARGSRELIQYFGYRYSWSEVYRNTWAFNDDGKLTCLTCEVETEEERNTASNEKTTSLESFSQVNIKGDFNVTIKQGSKNEITVSGPSRSASRMFTNIVGNQLNVNASNTAINLNDLTIELTVEYIDYLNITEGATVTFDNADLSQLSISTNSDSRALVNGNIDEVRVFSFGRSRVDLEGTINDLNVDLNDGARLYAYEAQTKEAAVVTEEESRARLTVNEYLSVEASGFSSVRYKGNPEVNIVDKSTSASISEY